jgi:hypothetical protein
VQRSVQILGSLDGIETGVRQLIREAPLETMVIDHQGTPITIPTAAKILRIKGVLILKRNATRDYLDFIALTNHIGNAAAGLALQHFDTLYPRPNSPATTASTTDYPLPYDQNNMLPGLAEYKGLDLAWHAWSTVKAACADAATLIFDQVKRAATQSGLLAR